MVQAFNLDSWIVNFDALQPNSPPADTATAAAPSVTSFNFGGLPFTNSTFSDVSSVPGPSGQGAPNPFSSAPVKLNDPSGNPVGAGPSPFLHPTQTFQPNAFGPSIVTGNNTADLSTPIVPTGGSSGGQTLAGSTPANDATTLGGDASFSMNSPPADTASGGGTTGGNQGQFIDPVTGNFIDPATGNQDTGLTGAVLGSGLGSILGPLGLILGGAAGTAAGAATGNTAGASGGDFFSNIVATAWNFAQRFGLVILGLVLIGVGAFWLAAHTDAGRSVTRRVGVG